jgi:sterol 3beta-glucosyltransferase
VRVAVFTFGSTGDLLPFLALAAGLRARGHEVVLCAPSVYEAKVASTGVPFRRLGEAFDPAYVTALMQSAIEIRDPVAQIEKIFADGICRGAEAAFRDAVELTEAADVVVANITAAPAMAAAEAVGRPLVTGVLNHGLVPSAHHGFPGLPSVGTWLNPLEWRFGRWLVSRALDPHVNRFRALAGLAPASGFAWDGCFSRTANLIAISPALAERRPDWPEHHHVTGYWFLEEPGFAPSAELASFLDAGDPPLLVSFGSNTERDPAAVTALLVDAVRRTGRRALLQDGWAGLGGETLPPGLLRIGWVPYPWLLERCAGVVHHAGSGTTSATLRAGRVSVAIPKGFDQPFWADEVVRLGAGVKLPRTRLGARSLAAAIDHVLGSGSMRSSAWALGERIREEDGVERACRVIDAVGTGDEVGRR